jgi:hypothetical protein
MSDVEWKRRRQSAEDCLAIETDLLAADVGSWARGERLLFRLAAIPTAYSVFVVVTQGTGASLPKTDVVQAQPSPSMTSQEIANNAAIANNTDPSPVVVSSFWLGDVTDDISAGGLGSTYFFVVTTTLGVGSLAARYVLSKDVQQNFAAWSSGTTYALNQTVNYSDGNSYISLQAANTNHAPSSSATWWRIYNRTAAGRAVQRGVDAGGAGASAYALGWLGAKTITLVAN